ncbi:uncharacterized protein LOC106642381 [Copidosoma floridanum]|uniref:uncharacterized protein LOC106642381 n=1 Tax=Copidosoma floridanum TaxID=29053 RepID=UPI0006C9CB4E|nr:uncharacterized protein LOC106642381 [Copidosoma floridanum]
MSNFEGSSHEKLEQVLKLFLQPKFNVVSTTYLDLLLTHIKDAVKNGDKKIFQIIQDWLTTVLHTWNSNCQPSQNLIVFTIKLIGTISVEELDFLRLSQDGLHTRMCEIFGYETENSSASIKMAFSIMLVNLLEHQSGRLWIANTGAWKQILVYAQQNHTMYVTRECHKFLSRLLILENKNEDFCREMILAISEPLMKVTIDSQTTNKLSDQLLFNTNKQLHNEQMNLLQATIELLLQIIDYTTFYDFTNPIPAMFEKLVSMESRVKTVFETTISTPMVKVVHKLVKLLIFVKLRSSVKETDEVIPDKIYEQFTFGLYYHAMMLLSKNYITDFVLSKKLGYEFWKRLIKTKPLKIPKTYRFEDQNVALMILPLTATFKPEYMKKHYLFEEFINKMFDITSTPVQRLAYAVRDVILKNNLPMEAICVVTVNYLLEMADIMDREAAVMVFQVLCHSLKNFVMDSSQNNKSCFPTDNSTVDGTVTNNSVPSSVFKKQIRNSFLDGDPINDKKTLLAALLNGLNTFTEKYKLKWQECVETICMLSIAQDILNHTGVDSKICILALKTCKLSIQNFMPPNLALLVDFDEYTKQIGPTLFKRIHDTNWEVQDSVLEILNTIACLSEFKYPPYQSFLLENHFLQVAIDIVKRGGESYVRASALTFISTAVRINTLWEKLLSQLNLLDIAIKILHTESEAIVRREAVALIKALYIHRKWQKPMIDTMSNAMTVAAVHDLHWEVKVNALDYWRHFITSHLTDQGMLDGHFPACTFSKQHRKIVTLDATEIKQRLNKALDELSQQNCLGVLLVTLKDESDLEVSRTSANIIGNLRNILLKYMIDEPEQKSTPLKDIPTIDSSYKVCPQNTAQSSPSVENVNDAVIEAIVDASDANLLAAIYNETMKMDESIENSETINGKETLEYIKSITRPEFLNAILKFNLDEYIKERSEWLQNYTVSFNSVLDDILVISNQKEINTMDCY